MRHLPWMEIPDLQLKPTNNFIQWLYLKSGVDKNTTPPTSLTRRHDILLQLILDIMIHVHQTKPPSCLFSVRQERIATEDISYQDNRLIIIVQGTSKRGLCDETMHCPKVKVHSRGLTLSERAAAPSSHIPKSDYPCPLIASQQLPRCIIRSLAPG